jgi:hypothetical protein
MASGKKAGKRAAAASNLVSGPTKRLRKADKGSASQPITIDGGTQPSSPRQAIAAASQGTDFETQVRNAVPEAAIVAPLEGSEAATIATTEAAVSEDDDEDEDEDEEIDAHLQDNFEGIDWSRLTKYCKPPRTQKQKKSWVYKHGYRVVLQNNMEKIFFICRAYHLSKHLNITGEGAADTTLATSSAAKHLRSKHRVTMNGIEPWTLHKGQRSLAMVAGSGVKVSQSVANEIGHFNVQRFRLAAVKWLVDNNIPLSQFGQPNFREMIKFANPEAEAALWLSHHSVARFVMRLYDYMKPQVISLLDSAMSQVHISFDGWTTKGGKRGFFSIVAHFVDNRGIVRDVAIDLPQLSGAHSGDRIADCVEKTLQAFRITAPKLGYFVLDNASNNDTAIATLGHRYGFLSSHRRLRCGAHTINLVGQAVIFGSNKSAYDNNAENLPASLP